MKSKKVVGALACALACASIPALANTTNGWFGVDVSNSTLNLSNVSTNGVAIELESTKFTLDTDEANPLVFTPDASFAETNKSDGVVVIAAAAGLTPSSTNDLGVVENAKAGFAVGIDGEDHTNYYGYASGAWKKFTTVDPPDSGDTEFKLVIDYRVPNVTYFVKNGGTYTQLDDALPLAEGTETLQSIGAYGTGSISSITSGYEVAVAAVASTGTKYGSAAEAVVAAGENGTVLDIDSTTGEATTTRQADNGLFAWECDILGIEEDAAIPLEPASKEVASDKIAVAVSGFTPVDGVSVKFGVSTNGGAPAGEYDADAIGIPMDTGTYTIVPVIRATSGN